ncbi:hypothetical protein FNF27_06828 [Cafeteria roenbergensis]|uniref:Tubulin--tyrosine ligase-like protein 9 n=2 Tax=Cafeteria roenbergensis TaxID=33653 RepID=A0A5A8DYM2_CAFRO|nr:hypothetical protein FNF27_06828 [Cafeteria roenbergensis]
MAAAASSAEASTPEIYFRVSFRNTILDALRSRPGWIETDSDTEWDFNWANVEWIREFFDRVKMDDEQRVNHFRNHYELTRKDLLVKNVKRMRKQLGRMEDAEEAAAYDFVPESFVLPGDYALFVEAFRRLPGTTWIMKPVGRAQGRGIFLITKLSQISEWRKDHTWKGDAPKAETYIVQRYVDRPYTVGNKKFDCRLYTLVTSFTPLTVWLYRGGFARFSSARYDHSAGTEDLHMHLTNVAIQKKTAAYAASGGSKWSMRNLKLFMASKHGLPAVNRLMGDIEALIIRSLLACQQVVIQDRHSFELYGYDVLWDESLKPWLLEVNASPSLSADTDSDYRMKRAMLSDMLDVLDLEGVRSGDELSVGGFDCIWDGGPTAHDRPAGLSSWLGTLPPSDAHFEGMTKASGKAGAAAEAPSTPLSEPDAAAADATAAAAGSAAAAAGAAASGAGAAPASELPAGVEVPPPIRGLAGVDAGRGMTTSPIVAPAGRQSRRD